MSITVALVDASLLSLRRASGRLKMVGTSFAAATRVAVATSTSNADAVDRVGVGSLSACPCFTWRRRNVTLGDLLAGAKDVPSGCTVACILFVHFVHTVKASRKAYHGSRPGARTGSPRKIHGVVALSFCTLERRRSGDWRTRGRKKIYTKPSQKPSRYPSAINSLISLELIFSFFSRKLRNWVKRA